MILGVPILKHFRAGENILDKIMYVYFSQSLDCGFQNVIFCFNDMYITESKLLCFS